MKNYLLLQYRMINRRFAGSGMPPLLGYLLGSTFFIGGSAFIFNKTEYAGYLYVLIAYVVLLQLSDVRRNEFLKTCFDSAGYRLLRVIENLIVALPFSLFLAFKSLLIPCLIVLALAFQMAFIKIKRIYSLVLPTPFSRQPYEFAVGFRNGWYLIALAYLLTVISVIVGNFNLGAFALIFIFLLSLSFYGQPEHEYLVWINSLTPGKFLLKKIQIASLHSSILSIPVLLLLLLFFYESWLPLLIIQGVGYLALTTMILARYSAFPDPINLPQGIMLALAIQLPVLLVIVIPYFYLQSLKKLNRVLR